MIVPVLSDDALLADVAAAGMESHARGPAGRPTLWWLGQSGFLVQWAGRHLLLAPYLSDSLTARYAATDKPHVRMTELCIRPERLDFIDVVASSHNHTDHFDPDTLSPLMAANRDLTIVIPEVNREVAAERLGCEPRRFVGLDVGQTAAVAGFSIAAVPAAHDVREQDAAGHERYLGYIVRCGDWTIYHSGDTRLYDGMVELLRPYRVDIALLPINGRAPERRVAGNLNGKEAATLAHAIGAAVAIPCHYDMFTFNTATPEAFVRTAAALGQKVVILACGERWSPRGEPGRSPTL